MNSAINPTQQSPPPWERLSNESAKAFAAFCVYRDLPPSRRSLDEAGRIIHGTQEGRKRGATGRLREGAEIRCRSIILAQRNPKKSGVSPSFFSDPRRNPVSVHHSSLILVLAVPRAAKARRLARLFRAQQKWAELMDRHEEGKWTSLISIGCERKEPQGHAR